MQLIAIGTGYINSEITKGKKRILKNNEELFTCYFQFANYNYTDKNTRKKIYSYYLCEVAGNYGKIVYDNFVKGQKIFISAKETQQLFQDKNGNYKALTMLHIEKMEFMSNPKKDEDKTTNEPSNSIDENIDTQLENDIINEVDDLNIETFS